MEQQIADVLVEVLQDMEKSYEKISRESDNDDIAEFANEQANDLSNALDRLE